MVRASPTNVTVRNTEYKDARHTFVVWLINDERWNMGKKWGSLPLGDWLDREWETWDSRAKIDRAIQTPA
jgi:hypothetical protein